MAGKMTYPKGSHKGGKKGGSKKMPYGKKGY